MQLSKRYRRRSLPCGRYLKQNSSVFQVIIGEKNINVGILGDDAEVLPRLGTYPIFFGGLFIEVEAIQKPTQREGHLPELSVAGSIRGTSSGILVRYKGRNLVTIATHSWRKPGVDPDTATREVQVIGENGQLKLKSVVDTLDVFDDPKIKTTSQLHTDVSFVESAEEHSYENYIAGAPVGGWTRERDLKAGHISCAWYGTTDLFYRGLASFKDAPWVSTHMFHSIKTTGMDGACGTGVATKEGSRLAGFYRFQGHLHYCSCLSDDHRKQMSIVPPRTQCIIS